MRNKNPTLWEVGTVHTKPPVNFPELCTDQVFHAFIHPVVAVILSPGFINFDINTMRLFEAEGVVVAEDCMWGKVGVFELKITKELALPKKEELLTFMKQVTRCGCSECEENWKELIGTESIIAYSGIVLKLEAMFDDNIKRLVTPKELTV
jgi:hypothetical protein